MVSVVEFSFVNSKSGKITFTPPSSYVAATGYVQCQTGQDMTTGENWRAFFNFNTAAIPDHARITRVEFLIRKSTIIIAGEPEIYRLKFSIGTFIGAALNGNAAEFNGGTLMVALTSKPDDNTWLDLSLGGGSPGAYVNRAGDTDIKVWDDSTQGSGDSAWGLNFNTSKAKCKLRVTYSVPSATATGRGLASCNLRAFHLSKATATGCGIASCSLTPVIDPLSRHFATRAVAPAHAGARSVSGIHHASVKCVATNAQARGPRRIS